MPNTKKIKDEVKTWATSHLILAAGAAFAAGVIIEALLT